jgi:hypothetical protein
MYTSSREHVGVLEKKPGEDFWKIQAYNHL